MPDDIHDKILQCPSGCGHFLSDDGHDGNPMCRSDDGLIGIYYNGFFEGNWSPTPPGCYHCGKFYTLPDLVEAKFGARHWILIDRLESDAQLKTPTGGYYTRREFCSA